MAEHRDLDELFTDIAGQIRTKKGTANPIKADDLPYEVSRIISEGGVDTSDATATSDEIAQGKTAYLSDGGIHTGTQPVRDYYSVDVREDSEGNMVARVPNGIYKNSTDVVLTNAVVHKPAVSSVQGSGKVTLTPYVEMTKGFQKGGTTTGYPVDITAQDVVSGSIAITPTSGGFTQNVTNYANAVVAGDVNLIPQNVKKDVTIFGTVGTLETQGIDPSDATATADDIALNKTAYIADGSKAVGTQPTKSSEDITFNYDGSNLVTTVPHGLYKNNTYKNVPNATAYIPGATVSITGSTATIRPYYTTTSGYITSGTRYGNYQTIYASNLTSGNLSVTPTKAGLVTDITTYSTLTVQGESNLIPGNIAKDVSIFGVVGTLDSGGVHTSDATATAADILAPKTAYVSDGTKAVGTIETLSAFTHVPTTTDINIPAGKYLGGAQTIKGDPNLVSSYIAKDISIFGVTGNLEAFQPAGTINISANGLYDVYSYASAQINVSTGGGEDDFADWVNFGDASIFERNAQKFYNVPSFFAQSNTGLSSAYLPNCTAIGSGAFTYCSGLKTLYAPNCALLETDAFFACKNLSQVNLNNLVQLSQMGSSSFNYVLAATSIRQLNLPRFLVGNYWGWFADNHNLSMVSLPILNKILASAFVRNSSLKSVYAPLANYLGDNAFYRCSSLSLVSMSLLQTVGSFGFGLCSNLASISFPFCLNIGSNAFGGDESLKFIDLGATYVGSSAFAGDYALSEASLMNCGTIYSYAFYQCSSLATVWLTASTFYQGYTFAACSSLKSIYLKCYAPNTIGSTVFPLGESASYSIYVHPNIVATVKGMAGWSYYSDKIVEMPTNEIDGIFAYQYRNTTSIVEVTDSLFSTPKYVAYGAFMGCTSISQVSLSNCQFVGWQAFSGCGNLSTVSLPNCSRIYHSAFFNCGKLSDIYLPNVEYIGAQEFAGLPISYVSLPKCKVIDYWAFSVYQVASARISFTSIPQCLVISEAAFYRQSKNASLYAPNVRYISDNAFIDNWALSLVDITNCNYIGKLAFAYCSLISELNIDNVYYINYGAFLNCSGLNYINAPNCQIVGEYAFQNMGSISYINLSQCKKIYDSAFYNVYVGGIKQSWFDSTAYRLRDNVVIENSTNKFILADYSSSHFDFSCFGKSPVRFNRFPNASYIKITGLLSVPNAAFSGCTNLSEAYLPNVNYIETNGFSNDTNLKVVELSSNMTGIGAYAFRGCTELSVLQNVDSISWIGVNAFRGCGKLKNLPLQNLSFADASICQGAGIQEVLCPKVSQIMSNAFSQCSSLSYASLDVCHYMDSYAFYTCRSLKNVYAPNLKRMSNAVFGHTGLEVVDFPKLTSVYSWGFYSCSQLSYVSLPNVTWIYSFGFTNCSKLVSAYLPKCGIITENAFSNCTSLERISLPAAVGFWGWAFQGCTNLSQVLLYGDQLASCQLTTFNNCNALSGIYVPNYLVNQYKSAYAWSSYSDIIYAKTSVSNVTHLSVIADECLGNFTNTTVHINAIVNGIENATENPVLNEEHKFDDISAEFPQNTSRTESVDRQLSYTYEGRTVSYTVHQLPWTDYMYTMDNSIAAYNFSTKYTSINPDPELYDGVYMSNNQGKDSTQAVVKITFTGYTNFTVYIRSYAEGTYDYTIASVLDASSYPTSAESSGLVKVTTKGNQQSGTGISSYTKVEYPNDGNSHYIYIVYRKDGSGQSGTDTGYFFIKKTPD